MIIRPAQREDASAIAKHIAMAEGEMMTLFTGSEDKKTQHDWVEKFILSTVPNRYSLGNCLVADIDGKAVGMVLAFPADAQPGLDTILVEDLNRRGHSLTQLSFEGIAGTYYLSTMGVDPDQRGKGVGAALMNAAMENGRELGFGRVSLLVSLDKPRAQALYERQGFLVVQPYEIAGTKYNKMIKTI